jgi:hypothetical protein
VVTLLVRVFKERHRRYIAFLLVAVVAIVLAGGAAFAVVHGYDGDDGRLRRRDAD